MLRGNCSNWFIRDSINPNNNGISRMFALGSFLNFIPFFKQPVKIENELDQGHDRP